LFLICFYLHLLFDYTVGCQHLVEWRSGHSLHQEEEDIIYNYQYLAKYLVKEMMVMMSKKASFCLIASSLFGDFFSSLLSKL